MRRFFFAESFAVAFGVAGYTFVNTRGAYNRHPRVFDYFRRVEDDFFRNSLDEVNSLQQEKEISS